MKEAAAAKDIVSARDALKGAVQRDGSITVMRLLANSPYKIANPMFLCLDAFTEEVNVVAYPARLLFLSIAEKIIIHIKAVIIERLRFKTMDYMITMAMPYHQSLHMLSRGLPYLKRPLRVYQLLWVCYYKDRPLIGSINPSRRHRGGLTSQVTGGQQ